MRVLDQRKVECMKVTMSLALEEYEDVETMMEMDPNHRVPERMIRNEVSKMEKVNPIEKNTDE